jgi:hypothetical protein
MASLAYIQNDPRSGLLQEANPPQIPDMDRRIQAALAGERGSTWSELRNFEWYESGLVFLKGPIQDFEIEGMLRSDGRGRAVEQALTLPIRGARYEIQPGKGDKGEAAFAEELLTLPAEQGGMRTPLADVISQAAMASLYRSACFEKVYKINDQGQVVYDKVAYRPPTSCYLARSAKTAHLEGFLQWTWTDIANFQRIYIPTAKSWIYLHGIHRDPIMGSSDIEVAYRAFQTKQKLRWLWAAYLEGFVMPRTKVNSGNDDVQLASALAARVAATRGGGVIGLTAGQDVQSLQPGSESVGQAFVQAISYCDEEMYSSILASFLGLGTASGVRGGGGSYALSLSQTDFYLQSRWAHLGEQGQSMTHGLIAPMIKWNFGHKAVCPKFKFVGLAPTENITEALIQMVSALVATPTAAGVEPPVPEEFNDELVGAVAGMFGFSGPKIHAAIKAKAQRIAAAAKTPAEAANAPLHGAADVLTAAVAKAQTNGHVPVPAA